jgi:hypothetical protein
VIVFGSVPHRSAFKILAKTANSKITSITHFQTVESTRLKNVGATIKEVGLACQAETIMLNKGGSEW